MKSDLAKLLSVFRYSTEYSKCTFQFRRYCSKSDDKSTGKSGNKEEEDLETFEYPETQIKLADYAKPLSHYFVEDMKSSFSFLNRSNSKTKDITDRRNFPYDNEFLILGAGPLGSCIAFWLKKKLAKSINILVLDKNLSVKQSSDVNEAFKVSLQSSICTIKQEYELKENVELSQFGAEFLRNMTFHCGSQLVFPDVPFQPFGFLTLSSKKNSEKLKKIHTDGLKWKGHSELLTAYQLNQRYPWLNTSDIEFAVHGLKDEGWFDPDIFLMKMRSLAIQDGVKFIEGEPLELVYREDGDSLDMPGFDYGEYKPCNHVYVKLNNGEIRKIQFATCIVALGGDTGLFAKEKMFLDKKYRGMHHFEVPIVPRKRHLYCIACPEGGPGISSPLITDDTGLFIKRYGPLNEFICGCPPALDDESTEKLSDLEFFEKLVWPLLVTRIPAFKNLQLISSHTYYEDFNTFDGNPIVGYHPAYLNFVFVAGFGDRSYQHAPGIGKVISEIYAHGNFKTIDITRFSFNRIIQEVPLIDSAVI